MWGWGNQQPQAPPSDFARSASGPASRSWHAAPPTPHSVGTKRPSGRPWRTAAGAAASSAAAAAAFEPAAAPPQQQASSHPANSAAAAVDEHRGAPPIAERALGELPLVKITEEDLIQDGNDECCVCLEPQRVGDVATKLPCGHLYHSDCVVSWLRRHGTCPNCRYELESSDARFESGRRCRMAARAFRDVTEKRDLIMRLVETGVVQLVKEDPPKALDVDEAGMRATWSIKQLKRLMAEIGVDSTKLRLAGAQAVVEPSSPANDDAAAEKRPRRPGAEAHDAKGAPRSLEFVPPPAAEGYCYREDDAAGSPAGSPPRPPRSLPPDDDGPAPLLVFTRQELGDLSVRRLKDALELVGLADELRGCSEKAELRSLLANSGDVRILP
ncbi:ubiquitin-protein transferase [Aureococcus anophagefferens]|nr:ubiquitin-protein transferase [Aureococcus anophagefferens]